MDVIVFLLWMKINIIHSFSPLGMSLFFANSSKTPENFSDAFLSFISFFLPVSVFGRLC